MSEQTSTRLPRYIDRTPNATTEEQTMFPALTAQQVRQVNNVSGVAFDAINKNIELFKSPNNTERASVLDLGAGNGRNAQVLAKAGLNVIAVENNLASIKNLEKNRRNFSKRKAPESLLLSKAISQH